MPHIETIARALIRRGNHVLLCRALDGGYDYLPGGHIEFGEPAAIAVARELDEEAGLDSTVGPLLLAFENRFTQDGRQHHELTLVFHVELSHTGIPATTPPGTSIPPVTSGADVPASPPPLAAIGSESLPTIASREPHIAFKWVELAALLERDLRPEVVKAWLLAQTDDPAERHGAEWISAIE